MFCKLPDRDTSGLALLGLAQNSSQLSGTLTDGAGNPLTQRRKYYYNL